MPEGPILIRDHGLDYAVDLAEGQKTGLYLDQRETARRRPAIFAGAGVLDMFCYTGGFSLAAVASGGQRGKCWASIPAPRRLRWPRRMHGTMAWSMSVSRAATALPCFQSLRAAGERFDAIVLDPPKFARSRRAIDEALRQRIIF